MFRFLPQQTSTCVRITTEAWCSQRIDNIDNTWPIICGQPWVVNNNIFHCHIHTFVNKKIVTPRLQHTSCNGWQTSLFGQLRITSNSTFIKLNSSSSRGKTALTWTCQSLLRMLHYCLHLQQGTWVWSSPRNCPAPTTSVLWPDAADLPSITSTGAGLSSQRMQRNSWSKCLSSPAWSTATHS